MKKKIAHDIQRILASRLRVVGFLLIIFGFISFFYGLFFESKLFFIKNQVHQSSEELQVNSITNAIEEDEEYALSFFAIGTVFVIIGVGSLFVIRKKAKTRI